MPLISPHIRRRSCPFDRRDRRHAGRARYAPLTDRKIPNLVTILLHFLSVRPSVRVRPSIIRSLVKHALPTGLLIAGISGTEIPSVGRSVCPPSVVISSESSPSFLERVTVGEDLASSMSRVVCAIRSMRMHVSGRTYSSLSSR